VCRQLRERLGIEGYSRAGVGAVAGGGRRRRRPQRPLRMCDVAEIFAGDVVQQAFSFSVAGGVHCVEDIGGGEVR